MSLGPVPVPAGATIEPATQAPTVPVPAGATIEAPNNAGGVPDTAADHVGAGTALLQSSGVMAIPNAIVDVFAHPIRTAEGAVSDAKQFAHNWQAATLDQVSQAAAQASHGHYFRAMGTMLLGGPEQKAAVGLGRAIAVQPVQQIIHEAKTPGEHPAAIGHAFGTLMNWGSLFGPDVPNFGGDAARAAEAAAEGATAAEVRGGVADAVKAAEKRGFTAQVAATEPTLPPAQNAADLKGRPFTLVNPEDEYGARLTEASPGKGLQGQRVLRVKPNVIDVDQEMPAGARKAFSDALEQAGAKEPLREGATTADAQTTLRKALDSSAFDASTKRHIVGDLVDSIAGFGYDGFMRTGGNGAELTLFNRDAAVDFLKDAFDRGADLTTPVTAAVAAPKSLGGKLAGMFGSSVFGAAINRVRTVQNTMAQNLLEAAFNAHLQPGMAVGDFLHSPLALGSAVSDALEQGTKPMYAALDAAAGHATVQMPTWLANPTLIADPTTMFERAGDFAATGDMSRDDLSAMSLREAMATRQKLAKLARTSSDDTTAALAGARMRAYDRAINNALTTFDASRQGKAALASAGISSASLTYRQANSLWGDSAAIGRVTDKISSTLGRPTEAIGQAVNPQAVHWDFRALERTLNDPANDADLLRTFRTRGRLDQFKKFVNLAAQDGGKASGRLAAGVGSLFLGNYPLYRAVWTLSSASPHAMGTVGAMIMGYRVMARLAVEPRGAALLSEALEALRVGRGVLRTGAILAIAAQAERSGFGLSGASGLVGAGVPTPQSAASPTVPASQPTLPAPSGGPTPSGAAPTAQTPPNAGPGAGTTG